MTETSTPTRRSVENARPWRLGARMRKTFLVYPPIVSPACLLIAVVLAVFKPWGRIRRRPAAPTNQKERS